MTVFAKDITYGLETTIKDCQNHLYDKLSILWGGTLDIYGIIEKNLKNDFIIPEVYIGSGVGNKEYSQIFINDRISATIGFLIQSRSTIPYKSANVDVIFTLQINKIYPESMTRDTEKALLQAQIVLENFGAIDQVQGIKENISDVFSDFSDSGIKYKDMHKWYVFSLNIDLEYTDNLCQ